MSAFVRTLQLELPYDRGQDVVALQTRLAQLGLPAGPADGVYGRQTAEVLKTWQARQGLPATGKCDEDAWNQLFPEALAAAGARLSGLLPRLTQDHTVFPPDNSFAKAYVWRLDRTGLCIDKSPARGSGGPPDTVRRIWEQFGAAISGWCNRLSVPAELIVATIATESGGDPQAVRLEPGYISDEATPDKVSPGLMQTLLSTARASLTNPAIDRNWLMVPENSIQAGTNYILQQSKHTAFDPPIVACCYNAGSVSLNDSPNNPWRMLQYPIGTGEHCDRFVKWFNDCMQLFGGLQPPPQMSFTQLLRGR
jgi:hypothetical protein